MRTMTESALSDRLHIFHFLPSYIPGILWYGLGWRGLTLHTYPLPVVDRVHGASLQSLVGHLAFVTDFSRLLWGRWYPCRAVTVRLPTAVWVTVTVVVVLTEVLTVIIPVEFAAA